MVTRCIWFGFVVFVLDLVIAFVFGICCCLLSGVAEGDNFARVPMLQTLKDHDSVCIRYVTICIDLQCDIFPVVL